GDVKKAAAAILGELERGNHQAVGYRSSQTAEMIASSRRALPSDEGQPGAIDPRLAMHGLDRVVPRDRIVVSDAGHHMMWATEYLSVPGPDSWILPLEYYTVGNATGVAVGAAIARPDRLTVYAAGDAGLMMSLGDLETAARYRLPMLVVVTNDSGLGAE